jgi:hypothetical protein
VTGQYGFATTIDLIMLSNPAAILAFALVADDDLSVTASGGTGALEYSINGTTFQAENTFNDLSNGIYTVTVRDANGCTATAQAIVAVNTLLATLEIAASVSCFNGEDGALVVNVGGGASPYTYTLVSSGASQSENVFVGLAAGEYEVLVLDNQGLSVTTNAVVLANPTAIAVAASAVLNVVTVTASGGTGALVYSLNGSPFQSSNVFANLTNGVYQVTVRDVNNCSQSTTVTVDVPPLLLSAASTGTILCFGDASGEIVASATGGVPPYAYKLNTGNFQASAIFSGLTAGNYNVTVRDAAGVETNFTVTVNQPAQIAASASVSFNDVTITASGGTGTLEYSTDGAAFQASNQFLNLANATYILVVRDANGCTRTVSATVAVPPLGFSFFTQHLVCFGDTDGSITVTGTGGIPPYTYRINGGSFQMSNVFDNLQGGTYAITIRDSEGTLFTSNVIVSGGAIVTVTPIVVGNDVTLTYNGGEEPYTYMTNAPNEDLQNLPNGTYNVMGTDANGCYFTDNFIINYTPVSIATQIVDNQPCDGIASLQITATGGVAPLTYALNNGAFQSSNTFNNLPSGTYIPKVKDGTGDVVTGTTIVLENSVSPTASATVNGGTITVTATGGATPYAYSINGGTAQASNVFADLGPGQYTVVVTGADGCSTSVAGLVVTTGLVEPSEAWGLAISPNPSAGLFRLTLQNAPSALRAEIFDVAGRAVRTLDFAPGSGTFSATLDLQNLPNGTYLLRLSDGENWGAVRLSKMD